MTLRSLPAALFSANAVLRCASSPALLSAVLCCLLAATAFAAPRPNIVVVLADDMGFSDIGCFGGEIQTPNLDRLAAAGVRFTQFYNCARCCPTRASLLSGLYPHQAGVGHMMEKHGDMPGYQGDLNRNSLTIAEALKTVGYKQGVLDNTVIFFLQDNGGCAEEMGSNQPTPKLNAVYHRMAPDELQDKIAPPMQTRDGRPVKGGFGVPPGPEDSYVAYGRNWANVSNTPFREYKHWVHEGGIATPLIAHWPAGVAASQRGQLSRVPGHLIDIMATCVDVAGVAYPRERDGQPITPLEGVSLAPALAGQSVSRTAPIFWEHEGNRALREGQWKLVAKGPAGEWELYDMEADRTEMHNLASQQPDRLKKMIAAWEAMAQRTGAIPWASKPPYKPTQPASP